MKKLLPAIALIVVFGGGVWFGSLFSFVAARSVNRYTGQALESLRTVSEPSLPSNGQENSLQKRFDSFRSDSSVGRQSNSGGTGGGSRSSAAAISSASGGDATFNNITVLNKAAVNDRLGIGTYNPTAKLEINGGAESNPEIKFLSGADNKSVRLTMGRGWVEATLAVAGRAGDWFTDALAGDFILRTENSRILLGVNSSIPQSALTVERNKVSVAKNLLWNNGRSSLKSNQGGSIELGDGTIPGETPYVDFHYGTGSKQDYNVRIINSNNKEMKLEAERLCLLGKCFTTLCSFDVGYEEPIYVLSEGECSAPPPPPPPPPPTHEEPVVRADAL